MNEPNTEPPQVATIYMVVGMGDEAMVYCVQTTEAEFLVTDYREAEEPGPSFDWEIHARGEGAPILMNPQTMRMVNYRYGNNG